MHNLIDLVIVANYLDVKKNKFDFNIFFDRKQIGKTIFHYHIKWEFQ